MPSSVAFGARFCRSTAGRFAQLALIALGLGSAACAPSRPVPPVLATLPEFHLLDAGGGEVTKATLGGRPFVADFVFTRCVASCPRLTERMKKLAAELPTASPARLVSISVDPEHDRPEVLRDYAARHGIADARWLFLTGDREAVWSL